MKTNGCLFGEVLIRLSRGMRYLEVEANIVYVGGINGRGELFVAS